MLDTLKEYAAKDRFARHQLVDSAADADAILFTENTHFEDYLFSSLSEHPLVEAYPEKVFMYNESDKPWSALPGLYCSMPKRFFQPSKQIAFPYLSTPNEFIKDVYKRDTERQWLFSFVGSVSHRTRRDVVALADVCKGVKDTSDFNVWDCTDDVKAAQGSVFADTMAASWFMLCPRGIGTSSYRLFETLEAGRAPVIISDQWVPTPHINWDFAVKVRERGHCGRFENRCCTVLLKPPSLDPSRSDGPKLGQSRRHVCLTQRNYCVIQFIGRTERQTHQHTRTRKCFA